MCGLGNPHHHWRDRPAGTPSGDAPKALAAVHGPARSGRRVRLEYPRGGPAPDLRWRHRCRKAGVGVSAGSRSRSAICPGASSEGLLAGADGRPLAEIADIPACLARPAGGRMGAGGGGQPEGPAGSQLSSMRVELFVRCAAWWGGCRGGAVPLLVSEPINPRQESRTPLARPLSQSASSSRSRAGPSPRPALSLMR